MGKKKHWLKEFWKEYHVVLITVAGFVFGVPLIVNGVTYFTEILPQNPLLIVISVLGTIVVGVFSQIIIKEAFK